MTSILDAIRESRRMTKMRLGQEAPEIIALPSAPEVRIALVPLTEAEYQQGLEAASTLGVGDNPYGVELRDRTLNVFNMWCAVRDPSDLTKKVFESADQMMDELGFEDINALAEKYTEMTDFSSPAIDGLDDKKLDDLKKAFETIDLSGLSGKPWHHLKMFFSTLTVEQLQVRSLLHSSILNSTLRNDESESTPGADQNLIET